MKIVTWNVNSVKARKDRLLAGLARWNADVVCLQELKCEADGFPWDEVRALGYHPVVHGQRTYNGVAILSRDEPTEIERGLNDGGDDEQARLVTAVVRGARIVCGYFPNGGTIGSDKSLFKLAWMKRLRAWLDHRFTPRDPIALCGDFNVAVDDLDVARPAEWEPTVLYHPEMRGALEHVRAFGFVDVVRKHNPSGGLYTWWDYRMLAFPKGNGLRIDHVFMTEPLAARSKAASVDRDERKGKQPSDHAPVIVELAD